jgi:hypothetical protein
MFVRVGRMRCNGTEHLDGSKVFGASGSERTVVMIGALACYIGAALAAAIGLFTGLPTSLCIVACVLWVAGNYIEHKVRGEQ